MKSEGLSTMRAPLATVEPNTRSSFSWPRDREMKETPLQCVKVFASSTPAQAFHNTTAHTTLASRPKTGNSETRLKYRATTSPQKVLPSIEHSPKKCLESGDEYSSRKCGMGAGKLVGDSAFSNGTTTNIVSSRQSTSMLARGLNSDMGKGRDDDWVPSSKEARDARPLPKSESRPVCEKQNHVPSTAGRGHRGGLNETIDLEGSPSPSPNSTPAKYHIKYESEDGQDLLRRPPSPTWNRHNRSWILEQEGIVEIPKEILEHESTLAQLVAQVKVMQEKEREERAKKQQREAKGHTERSTVNDKKRMAEDGDETMKRRKTPKNTHKQTPHSEVSIRSSFGRTELAVHADQVATKTNEPLLHGNRVPQHTWRNGKQRPVTEYERFRVPEGVGRRCTCLSLPEYFKQTTQFVPSLATWPGSRLEFLKHVKQLTSCSGHPLSVKSACCRILEKEKYPDKLGPHIAIDFAQEDPVSTTTTPHSQGLQSPSSPNPSIMEAAPAASMPRRRRNHSSGLGARARMHKYRSRLPSTNPLPLGPSATTSRVSSTSAGSAPSASGSRPGTSGGNRQTPPSSSPFTNGPRDARMDSSRKSRHEAQDDNSNGGHAQSSDLPAVVPPHLLPQTPLSVQKKRHQSMPATSTHRRHTPSRARREKALQGVTERISAQDAIPGSDALLYGFSAILSQLKKVAENFEQTANDHGNQTQLVGTAPPPPPPPPPTPPIAANAAATAQGVQPARRKGRSVAQRRAAGKPQLDKNVPYNLRESDERLLEIGKEPNGYQRHKLAPYAYSYQGRLYTEYIRLLTARDQQGNAVWDYHVMSRVRS